MKQPAVLNRFYAKAQKSNWRPVLKSGSAGVLNRLAGIALRLFTIPLAINYLGPEQYGLWVLVSSVAGYISLLDLGITSALINRVTQAHAIGDQESQDRYILATLYSLGAVAVVLSVATIPIIEIVDWKGLFKISDEIGRRSVTNVFHIGAIVFFVQLPLSIFTRLPYTFQRGHESEMFQLGGNLFSITGIVVSVILDLGLVVLICFLLLPSIVASVGLAIFLRRKQFITKWRIGIDKVVSTLRELRAVGVDFLSMQIVSTLMVVLQFNLLGYFKGAPEVAKYGLMSQIFIAIQMPFTILSQPLWTKFVLLNSLGNKSQIRIMMLDYLRAASGYGVFVLAFFTIGLERLLPLVLKRPLNIGFDLSLSFGISCCLGLLFGGGMGAMIAALGLTRSFALVSIAQFVLFLVAALLLTPALGSTGMVIATIVSYFVSVPYLVLALKKEVV